MYRPVPHQVDLPTMEHEVLDFWAEHDIFAKSVERTRDGEPWVFYEGPPTANGMPGTHHVEARVFKDVFPRFQTMKGRYVPRKAGWDCHGLPVELAVERELGFTGKPDIETYGIAAFNAKCRESVQRNVGAFEAMTHRMGYWVDMSQAYRTMDASYIESVWWSLKQIFDKGLLVQDHRVAPYCPRCGTGLSDHELAQGYETVVDPSVYVRFPVTGGPLANLGAALLVWTTTPWTLVANTAVAVNPDVTYAAARTADGEVLVLAEPLVREVLGAGAEVLVRYSGRDLELTPYTRPFALVDIPDAHFVVLADYVTGRGRHRAGPPVARLRRRGPGRLSPLRPARGQPGHGGRALRGRRAAGRRDVLQEGRQHARRRPGRARAALPARPVRAQLSALLALPHAAHVLRAAVLVHPHHPDQGCAAARERADQLVPPDHQARALRRLARPQRRLGALAATLLGHSPADLALRRRPPHCRGFTGGARRGGWAGPFGARPAPAVRGRRHGHLPYMWQSLDPGARGHRRVVRLRVDAVRPVGISAPGAAEFEAAYPAQFICEAIDQTRGWFYTLMAVGTLVFDRSSYENVVCLGHILDEEGRKMSKHLGNVLEPIPLMDAHGADAVRWFMAAGGSPWQSRRVGHTTIQEVVRKTLLTYWNTVSFQSLYARSSGWVPYAVPVPPVDERSAVDRWALSEAHRLALDVDAALEEFDTQRAGRLLAGYVDDLSNWYVRRSRRRFWAGDPAALATLHECLYVVTLLLAPITPFVTERVWQDLFASTSAELPESVHLASWPHIDGSLVDDDLAASMALVRRLVELGRATRAESGVKTRQPLGRALVAAAGWDALSDELRAQIADELNVATVAALTEDTGGLTDIHAKGNFRTLGKSFGKQTPVVAAAVAATDARVLADALREHGTATVTADGAAIQVTADQVVITETPREGWAVATVGGETVALDLTITPELRRAGLARDVVRLVQEARKGAGLDVSDRIELTWSAPPELAEALREHGAAVAEEVSRLPSSRRKRSTEGSRRL